MLPGVPHARVDHAVHGDPERRCNRDPALSSRRTLPELRDLGGGESGEDVLFPAPAALAVVAALGDAVVVVVGLRAQE